MLIFMEYCPEGTLEQLVTSSESGLSECLTRRFTRQLLQVSCKAQKMDPTHRLAATVIKFGELKNRIEDSYAVAVSMKQKAYM